MEVNRDKCNYCGICVGFCPTNCIFLDETVVMIDIEKCSKCGLCIRGCPLGAIEAEWFK